MHIYMYICIYIQIYKLHVNAQAKGDLDAVSWLSLGCVLEDFKGASCVCAVVGGVWQHQT